MQLKFNSTELQINTTPKSSQKMGQWFDFKYCRILTRPSQNKAMQNFFFFGLYFFAFSLILVSSIQVSFYCWKPHHHTYWYDAQNKQVTREGYCQYTAWNILYLLMLQVIPKTIITDRNLGVGGIKKDLYCLTCTPDCALYINSVRFPYNCDFSKEKFWKGLGRKGSRLKESDTWNHLHLKKEKENWFQIDYPSLRNYETRMLPQFTEQWAKHH